MASSLLPDRAIVAVDGEDAEALLNRLFTRNMLGMKDGEARYAALLSPQGKLLFDFLVLRTGDAFWLDGARDRAAELAKRLTVFKLRARATVADRSSELAVAASWAEPPPPEMTGLAVFRDPRDEALGFRIVGAPGTIAAQVGQNDYRAHRIALGIPEGGVDWPYGDTFVHDANLDLLGGVDFDKGCYVGQEVVSRVQHRGSARKRLVKLRFFGDPPASDVDLKAGPLAIGQVTSRAGREGLASVRIDRLREAAETSLPVTAGGTLVELVLPSADFATGGAMTPRL